MPRQVELIGAAWGLGRAQTSAVERLAGTARQLGEGNLDARVGSLEAAPELTALARTLDEMADELQATLARERTLETRRRDLITAVSHDLRTPLGNLRAVTEAIEDGVVEDLPTLHLTPKEFDLLHLLAAEPGRVFSRIDLLDELWDFSFDGDPATVTVHVRRLREKIEEDASSPRHLVTVWGAGYRFDP